MFPSGENPRVLATQVLVGSQQHENIIYSIHVVPVMAAFLLEEPCIATWQAEVASWLPVLLTPQGPAATLVASPATPGAVVEVPSAKPGPVQRKQTRWREPVAAAVLGGCRGLPPRCHAGACPSTAAWAIAPPGGPCTVLPPMQ